MENNSDENRNERPVVVLPSAPTPAESPPSQDARRPSVTGSSGMSASNHSTEGGPSEGASGQKNIATQMSENVFRTALDVSKQHPKTSESTKQQETIPDFDSRPTARRHDKKRMADYYKAFADAAKQEAAVAREERRPAVPQRTRIVQQPIHHIAPQQPGGPRVVVRQNGAPVAPAAHQFQHQPAPVPPQVAFVPASHVAVVGPGMDQNVAAALLANANKAAAAAPPPPGQQANGWGVPNQLAAQAANQHIAWSLQEKRQLENQIHGTGGSSEKHKLLLKYAAGLVQEQKQQGASAQQQQQQQLRRASMSSIDESSRRSSLSNSQQKQQPRQQTNTLRSPTNEKPALRDNPIATSIARKLLGYVPVQNEETPVFLERELMIDIADRIQMIVNKLVAIAGENKVNQKTDKAGSGSVKQQDFDFFQRQAHAKIEEQVNSIRTMQKEIAEKNEILKEQTKEIDRLRANVGQDRSQMDVLLQQYQQQVNASDGADQNHVIVKQAAELGALRSVVYQDAQEIRNKREQVSALKRKLAAAEEKVQKKTKRNDFLPPTQENNRQSTKPNHEYVRRLEQKVEHLQQSLAQERKQGTLTTKAYMKAAVHALETQKRLLDKKSRASE